MPISTQSIISVSLFTLALTTAILLCYDNTDRSVRSLRSQKAQLYMLSVDKIQMLSLIEQEHTEKVAKEQEIILKKAKANQNICLKNASATGNPKEQLQSFVEGDCAPVIFIPGLMATKLLAEIDCQTLLEKQPDLMEACGWSTCSWSLFGRRPASEYLLWIPELLSPIAFLTLTNNTCFGHIIRLNTNLSETNIYERYKSPEGIKVQWYGNTEQSRIYADSGFGAIEKLLPLPFQSTSTVGFHSLATYFTELGYQKGLSMFAIPYDFRQTHLASSISYTLERTIRYAYELTGKKVVLVCHSLGNLNALSVLIRMKQEDKDKMIAAYVALTAPYGGASKTVRLTMGGDSSFLFLEKLYGMDFYNQKIAIATSPSTQDLMPKDAFYRFRNEPWMMELLKRIEMEKNYTSDRNEGLEFWNNTDPNEIPYSFFPSPSNICFENFADRPKQCMTGITDLGSEPLITIKNRTYYANTSSLRELLDEHFTMNVMDAIEQMHADSLASGVHLFPNPNVPTLYLYGSHVATELSHEWDYNPEDLTKNGLYAFPTKTKDKYGDGTVEVSYSLPIALKWAFEHINNQPNTKPIKVAEYCSSFNQKGSIWDGIDEQGTMIINKTEYIGTLCGCLAKSPTTDCYHAGILIDTYIIELIGNTSMTKEKVNDKNITGAFRLPNDYLIELIDTLPHLRRPRDDQDVVEWLYPNGIALNQEKTIVE